MSSGRRTRRGLVCVISILVGAACGSDQDLSETATSALAPTVTTITATTLPANPGASPSITAAPTSRVLLIGDSTLLAVEKYNAFESLRGFEYVYDAESCRTLGVISCGARPKPPNSVEAINGAEGSFDIVVIMAGYDEWWTSFPSSFDKVVAASRAKGARHIVWLSYREGVAYETPSGDKASEAFVKNNETLRTKVSDPQFGDVLLLDWFGYTNDTSDWLTRDGIHLTLAGAHGVANYISRIVAHLDGRPCPVGDGELPVSSVCPNPDTVGP